MSFRDLQRRAVAEAELQDAAVAAFDADLRRVYRRLTTLLKAALADWDTDETGRTVTNAANLARVFALRKQARKLVQRAGFDEAAKAAIADPLDTLAASILRGRSLGSELGPNLRQMVEAWKDLRLADLLAVADDAARVIQRTVLDGTLGLRQVDRLILDVSEALAVSQRQARTIYDTSISIFSRQVEQATSTGEPDELFVYVGPVDGKMREFCETWVGKVRTRAQWEGLDNGTSLPNPFLTAGGWNCRHKVVRVSALDEELRAIAGTDQRAPGIDAQLAEAA